MRAALLVLAVAACSRSTPERLYRPPNGGDVARGEALMQEKGCIACHRVPGVRRARGVVGPPLDQFALRTFIAGRLPNTPQNLERWLLDPPAVDPATAMPRLGLDDQQARDVAAFLYTLD